MGKLEWVKGDGVDRDGHGLTWWKNKAAKWTRSGYDRPTVYISVTTWDRAGQRDKSRCGEFEPDDLKGAKVFARAAAEAGGSSQVEALIDIPHQSGIRFSLGEWKNTESNGYYVWSVDRETLVPVQRNGPFQDPDEAIALAKAKAKSGQTYDEIVTFGGDPEASDFSIWRSFKAWSGEVHYTTDLPKVGGRLREYGRNPQTIQSYRGFGIEPYEAAEATALRTSRFAAGKRQVEHRFRKTAGYLIRYPDSDATKFFTTLAKAKAYIDEY